MEKKILRLQKKSNKIFALFQKMIERLLKQNEKLQSIYEDALAEKERQRKIMLDSKTLIQDNNSQIEKLKDFIGRVEE